MLCLSVAWIGDVYEAALDDRPEWPPHPGRVFCALVAAAEEGSADDDALRWLEAQAPPVVLASESRASQLSAFVPTNKAAATAGNRLARTNGSRQWQRSHPRRPLVHLVWENADPSGGQLAQIDRLAMRVPFVGRSTSQAIVSAVGAAPLDVEGLERFEPGGQLSHRLRVPYPGYLAALREAFEEGAPARSVSRWAEYGRPVEAKASAPGIVESPWSDLLTLGFESGTSVDGRLVLRVATAFKKAVLQNLGSAFSEDELRLVNGHHDGSKRQCAFVALPFIGSPYSTGSILGLGLALSRDLSPDVRRAVLHLLGFDREEPRLKHLHVPGLTSAPGLVLCHVDGRITIQPDRWTGPSSEWVTAYPIAFDRFPHRNDEIADHVVRACELARFPKPDDVVVCPGPPLKGTPLLRGVDLRRRRDADRRPAVHARLRFGQMVQGPLVLGHLRHLGIGLCLPIGSDRDGTPQGADDA